MNKKLKDLLFTLITLSLILCCVMLLGILVRPADMDIAVDSAAALHDMPDDSIDVLCLGSSHMWRGLDPLTMRREYGIAAYNYGCYYQKINTTLLFLQDAFRTQSPKVVVIDTFYANRLKEDPVFDGELYSTKNITLCADKLRYLKNCFGGDIEKYLSYFVPLTAFHGNWVSLFSDTDPRNIQHIDLRETLGFAASDSVRRSSVPNAPAEVQDALSERAVGILTDIVDLCRKNGAEPVFITIPYEKPYSYSDAMTAFAEQHGCIYLNLFEYMVETGLDADTDFSDTSHLNSSGAKKIASFMGKYLSEHFDL